MEKDEKMDKLDFHKKLAIGAFLVSDMIISDNEEDDLKD